MARITPKNTERMTTGLVVMIPIFILALALFVGFLGKSVW